MSFVLQEARDPLDLDAIDRTIKLAEAGSHPWEKASMHTQTISMAPQPLSPIFILPPQKSSAVTIKAPRKANIQQSLPVADLRRASRAITISQNPSPNPPIAPCRSSDSATTGCDMPPPNVEDIAIATRRKFMESVWALSKAEKADGESTHQGPVGSTKATARPPPSDAPPKELKNTKSQTAQEASLEEMEFLAKIRALPHDSEERKAIIKERRMESRRRVKEARLLRHTQALTVASVRSEPKKSLQKQQKHAQLLHKPRAKIDTTIPSSSAHNAQQHAGSLDRHVQETLRADKAGPANAAAMFPRKPANSPRYEDGRKKSSEAEMRKMLTDLKELDSSFKATRTTHDPDFVTRKQTVNVDGVFYDMETVEAQRKWSTQADDAAEGRGGFSLPKRDATPETKASSTRTLYQSTPQRFSASKVAPKPSEKNLGYGLTSNSLNRRYMDIGTSRATRVSKPQGKENVGNERSQDAKPAVEYSDGESERDDSSSEDDEDGGAPLWD